MIRGAGFFKFWKNRQMYVHITFSYWQNISSVIYLYIAIVGNKST